MPNVSKTINVGDVVKLSYDADVECLILSSKVIRDKKGKATTTLYYVSVNGIILTCTPEQIIKVN